MLCDPESYKKKYAFFNSVDEYIDSDELAEKNGDNNIYRIDYEFINKFNNNKFSELSIMCNKFVYLVDALYKRNTGSSFNSDYDFDYLNYWLNTKINDIDCEISCKKSFFQNLRAGTKGIRNWGNLGSEIYNIEENELNDINTLYNLHKNFSKLNKEIKESNPKEDEFMTYAKNCVKGYQELKDKCTGNEPKFCENLTNFKQKYEEINLCKYNFSKWRKEKLPSLTKDSDESLPDCETTVKEVDRETEQGYRGSPEPVESHSNMNVHSITIGVVTTLVISFIYFIFYKFTSFGSLIRSRIVKEGKKPGNLDVDMDHFSHTSEYGHFNSESKTYGIAYNS
ncbi:PIR Superfamily Protein [Plasmodium ovale wallikeri]|uniref:PIR Superfamily Protein n=1 Tax=Plasmodium ovale wallikeri TaxID=864142 RepID=A0A1A9ARC5_PLAOA|nr:PIR Superfamily Protein [Plasmodium ovale wallikeri]